MQICNAKLYAFFHEFSRDDGIPGKAPDHWDTITLEEHHGELDKKR